MSRKGMKGFDFQESSKFRGYDYTQAKDAQGHTNRHTTGFPDGLYNVMSAVKDSKDTPFDNISELIRDCVIRKLDDWIDPKTMPTQKAMIRQIQRMYEHSMQIGLMAKLIASVDMLSTWVGDVSATRSWEKARVRREIQETLDIAFSIPDPYFRLTCLDKILKDNSILNAMSPEMKSRVKKALSDSRRTVKTTPKPPVKSQTTSPPVKPKTATKKTRKGLVNPALSEQ